MEILKRKRQVNTVRFLLLNIKALFSIKLKQQIKKYKYITLMVTILQSFLAITNADMMVNDHYPTIILSAV